MDLLPTYAEATSALDWGTLIAPYASLGDCVALSRVSRHFWHVFAPMIWGNVLRTVRAAGLKPADDIDWWFHFVFEHLAQVRPSTRVLCQVIDVRAFARDSFHFASDQDERTLQKSFNRALVLLPGIDCILLGGHPELDASVIIPPDYNELRVVSIPEHPAPVPRDFFHLRDLKSLVYLDISGIPGSFMPYTEPDSQVFRCLRILKIRDRELEDGQLLTLGTRLQSAPWSLDVSSNKITHVSVRYLLDHFFHASDLRLNQSHEVEGKWIADSSTAGSDYYGEFMHLEDSSHSGSFSHPQRYHIDAPTYHGGNLNSWHYDRVNRTDGRRPLLKDTPNFIIHVLSAKHPSYSSQDLLDLRGLTHLNISDTRITAAGVKSLLRNSRGHLQDFICDSPSVLDPRSLGQGLWPKSAQLYGYLGDIHLLRPAVSSNLQSLTIHHSVVTQIPSLRLDGRSALSLLYTAETIIHGRVRLAYGPAFVPDMNPRLRSLTLVGIPRRSSGLLIYNLTKFIKALAEQERSIEQARSASSWRSPGLVTGIRHLWLQFEPDPGNEDFSVADVSDAEQLLNSGDTGFSFFESERTGLAPTKETRQDTVHASSLAGHSNEDYIIHHWTWNGSENKIPVWISPARSQGNPVIDRYRWLILEKGIREGLGPVSPEQVVVGAPPKSYVFHITWAIAIMPPELQAPHASELANMKDVLAELKNFRIAGRRRYEEWKRRGPADGTWHGFWTGKLLV